MLTLKRCRVKRVTFRADVEVHWETSEGKWAVKHQPVHVIAFSSIFDAFCKTLRQSIYHLTVDRVYNILEHLKPTDMEEKEVLHRLIAETQQRQQILHKRGWVQLGQTKVVVQNTLHMILFVLNETVEDLDMLKELYDLSDEEEEEEIVAPQAKRLRKK